MFKKGWYWIGDCCYVLRKEHGYDWDEFCDKLFTVNQEGFFFHKKKVIALYTEYGDGEYPSNIGFNFPVDAGIIGLIPKSMWKGSDEPFGCKLVKFDKDFECYNKYGTLILGHVEIYTGDEDDF